MGSTPTRVHLTRLCLAVATAMVVTSCGTAAGTAAVPEPTLLPAVTPTATVASTTATIVATTSGGSAATVAESPIQVMVTPTGGPTPVPTRFAVAAELTEAAAMTYSVPVYYGYGGDVGVNSLGIATEAAHEVPLARQWFGALDAGACHATDSLMLWRGDTREVAFLLEGTEGSSEDCYPDYWLPYQDTWQQGEPNNEDQSPPPGYYVPVMGFGKVWREIRDAGTGTIGLATTEEQHTDGTVQRFENGIACYFPDTGEVYILLDRYRRIPLSGAVETRAWFRVP